MTTSQKQLWKVRAVVKPIVECERMGITTFKFGENEEVTFEGQLEDRKTEFSIKVISDSNEVDSRGEFYLKSLLALLELETRGSYSIGMREAKPVKTKPIAKEELSKVRKARRDVLFLEPGETALNIRMEPIPKLEGLDFALLNKVRDIIPKLDSEKRKTILVALNFLHDGLVALIPAQSFLSIYGGLNHLVSKIARVGTTPERGDLAIRKLSDGGLLEPQKAEDWKQRLRKFHHNHYTALNGGDISGKEVQEIKTFFRDFLNKFIEYQKIA